MSFIGVIAVSALAGYLFNVIGFPIPWMLGPAFAVLLCCNMLNVSFIIPVKFRNGGLVILGYVMGHSFNKEIALQIVRQLPVITVVTIITIIFSIVLALIICRPLKISPASAVLGCVPGGMTQMVILSDDIKEADLTIVTFMQTVRFVSVVVLVPFLVINGLAHGIPQHVSSGLTESLAQTTLIKLLLYVGAAVISGFLSEKFNFPTPYLVGPVLAVAAISIIGIRIPDMPNPITIMAQMSIGMYIGTSIKTESLKGFRKLFVITFLSSIVLIGFSFVIGLVLTRLFEMELITAFLSTAPGGTSEMAVTALTVNANLSFITAFQMFRLLFILFIVPPFLRWFLHKAQGFGNVRASSETAR